MIIRDFHHSDLGELVDVYNDARRLVECFRSEDVSSRRLRSLTSNESIQVAVVKQVVVGFISIWPPEKFIHHLYVRPSCQNLGIAKRLIKACQDRYGLPLSLKTLPANRNACDFYEYNYWELIVAGQGSEGPYHQYSLRSA